MDVAAFAISCLGLLVAVVAGWYSHRSVAEAKRSADAATDVAEVERARRADEMAEAERRRVRFELVQRSRDSWVLKNTGTDTAYGVHIDTGDLGGLQDEVTDFEEFEAERGHRIWLSRTFGSKTDHIVVTWHQLPDRSDEQRSVTLLGP